MVMHRKEMFGTQIVHAAYRYGQGATLAEIAEEVGVDDERSVAAHLKFFNIRITPRPFGIRAVNVGLSPAHVEGFRTVARARGFLGREDYRDLLEQVARLLASDVPLLSNVIDPGLKPIFVPSSAVAPLQEEAARRGVSVAELATLILTVVAKDKMFGAVIDDAEEEV